MLAHIQTLQQTTIIIHTFRAQAITKTHFLSPREDEPVETHTNSNAFHILSMEQWAVESEIRKSIEYTL